MNPRSQVARGISLRLPALLRRADFNRSILHPSFGRPFHPYHSSIKRPCRADSAYRSVLACRRFLPTIRRQTVLTTPVK